MEIKKFFEKAIKGGYKLTHNNRWEGEKIHSIEIRHSQWMGNKKKFLGKKPFGWKDVVIVSFKTEEVWIPLADTFLDPLVWKAVGKIEGWTEEKYDCQYCQIPNTSYLGKIKTYKYNMYKMINALDEGRTIEQFIKTL